MFGASVRSNQYHLLNLSSQSTPAQSRGTFLAASEPVAALQSCQLQPDRTTAFEKRRRFRH
jgi:hypothetical protein